MSEGKLFDEIRTHLEEQGKPEQILKRTAIDILEALGYKDKPAKILAHMEGLGVINAIWEKVPSLKQEPTEFIDGVAKGMNKVPEGARQLLHAAGVPDPENPKSRLTTLSIRIAKPSEKTIDRSPSTSGERKELWVTDVAGTDNLVTAILSKIGYSPNETMNIMSNLRKETVINGKPQNVTKLNIQKGPLRISLAKPFRFEKESPVKTAYSYRLTLNASSPNTHS